MACRRSLKAGQIAVLAYLAFVSLEFLALVVFKGTEATRDMIWASLHAGDKAVLSLDGQVSGAIEMLGYSVTALLRMPLGIVSSGSVWYWVFTIVASCAYLIVLSLGQQPRDSEVRHRIPWVFTVYALCFAASVPLLCLGGDWGRWIAAVNVAVAILICAGEYRQPLPVPLINPFTSVVVVSRRSASIMLAAAMAFTLSFTLPECCIVGNGKTLARFFHALTKEHKS